MQSNKNCVFTDSFKCESNTSKVNICIFCFNTTFKDNKNRLDLYYNRPVYKTDMSCKICSLPQEKDMEFGSIWMCKAHDQEFSV